MPSKFPVVVGICERCNELHTTSRNAHIYPPKWLCSFHPDDENFYDEAKAPVTIYARTPGTAAENFAHKYDEKGGWIMSIREDDEAAIIKVVNPYKKTESAHKVYGEMEPVYNASRYTPDPTRRIK